MSQHFLMCKPAQPQEGEELQEGMPVPQVPVLPLPLTSGSAAKQYQEALQGAQQVPMDVMQHMAHMQALLASASSAHLQACPLCSLMQTSLHHQVPAGDIRAVLAQLLRCRHAIAAWLQQPVQVIALSRASMEP